MHKYIVLMSVATTTFLMNQGMENSQQKSYAGKIFHLMDQNANPFGYFTDNKSLEICNTLLRFDPSSRDHIPYKGDNTDHKILESAFNRQKKLLTSIEEAVNKKNTTLMNQILIAQTLRSGYYSHNAIAVINGFLEKQAINANELVQTLKKQTTPIINNDQKPSKPQIEKEKEDSIFTQLIPESEFPPLLDIIADVTSSHPTFYQKTLNWVAKNIFSNLEYVTDERAARRSLAILHFDPKHSYHDQWILNPDLEWHKKLIHQAFERESKQLDLILEAVHQNNLKVLIQLNPNNQINQKMMQKLSGYYSPIAKATIAALLYKLSGDNQNDANSRANQFNAPFILSTSSPAPTNANLMDLFDNLNPDNSCAGSVPRAICPSGQHYKGVCNCEKTSTHGTPQAHERPPVGTSATF